VVNEPPVVKDLVEREAKMAEAAKEKMKTRQYKLRRFKRKKIVEEGDIVEQF